MMRFLCTFRSLLPLMLVGVVISLPGGQRCSAQELRPRAVLKAPEPVWCVAFSRDGKRLAGGCGARGEVITGETNEVRLWDPGTAAPTRALTGHKMRVLAVAFFPDGETLASGSLDGTVKLWDVETGKLKRTLTVPGSSQVWSLAISEDGKWIAAGSFDGRITLWRVQTGALERTLTEKHPVRAVAFAPDGRTLASGTPEAKVKLWDVATGKVNRTLLADPRHGGIGGPVKSLAFSVDGKLLACDGRPDTVMLWDPRTGQRKQQLSGHKARIWCIAFSGDGEALASGDSGGMVKRWDVRTGEMKWGLKGHSDTVTSVAFSPTGKVLASASLDRTIKLWDVTPGPRKSQQRKRRPAQPHAAGQGARRTTCSVTLPISSRLRPVRPCVPGTITSHASSLATRTSTSAASPRPGLPWVKPRTGGFSTGFCAESPSPLGSFDQTGCSFWPC